MIYYYYMKSEQTKTEGSKKMIVFKRDEKLRRVKDMTEKRCIALYDNVFCGYNARELKTIGTVLTKTVASDKKAMTVKGLLYVLKAYVQDDYSNSDDLEAKKIFDD